MSGTLYLVGHLYRTGEVIPAECCSMCKRLVINAGISRVVARISRDEYVVTDVQDWIDNDDSVREENYVF